MRGCDARHGGIRPLMRGLAASGARAYTVYVSNEKGNSITVIDSETLEVQRDHPRRPAPARHHR